jgi:threonine/homoserine/homoserine lactone efflux protein
LGIMQIDLLLPLVLFALATSITPGPNNLMLMASGANFGVRATVPHMLGVGLGFVFLCICTGLGLVQVFDRWPVVRDVLTAVAAVYLVWLAWKFGTAAPVAEGAARGRPMTFLAAAGFQWVNPKAWAMAITAVTVYAGDRSVGAVIAVAVIFGMVNIPSVGLWVVAGQEMRRWLTSPARLRAFNWTMAGLILLTLWPMLRM